MRVTQEKQDNFNFESAKSKKIRITLGFELLNSICIVTWFICRQFVLFFFKVVCNYTWASNVGSLSDMSCFSDPLVN